MCTVKFNLNTQVGNGGPITEVESRYKKSGETQWIDFSTNLINPSTPDLTERGVYDLQVRVKDASGKYSEWQNSTFEIDCDYEAPVPPSLGPIEFPNGDCCNNTTTT